MNIIDELKAMGDAAIAAQAGSLGGQVDMLASAGRMTSRAARYAQDLIQQARDRAKAVETATDPFAEGDIIETAQYGEVEVVQIWDSIAHEARMVKLAMMEDEHFHLGEVTMRMDEVEVI